MSHLYYGSGTVKDSTGTPRVIRTTMIISRQLQAWAAGGPGQPVQVTPGQPLPNGQYQFRISEWYVAVERIGVSGGESGWIYLEFIPDPPHPGFGDKMFHFHTYHIGYDWEGQITSFDLPKNWTNPSAPDYGHLPQKIECSASNLPVSGTFFSSSPHIVLTRDIVLPRDITTGV